MPQPFLNYLRRHHIALLALFVALGGTSYAAVKLPRNSVGTPQIKKNAVTSAKVKNRSLKAADFAAGQLPAGAQGAPGLAGPKGDAGSPDSGAQILGKLAGVDGNGSGLDADLLDGLDAAQLQRRGSATACAAGQVVTAIAPSGDVTCAADLAPVEQPMAQYQLPVDASDCNHTVELSTERTVAWRARSMARGTWPAAEACTAGTPASQQIVVPQAGLYEIVASVIWSTIGTGDRGIGIKSVSAYLAETRGPVSGGTDTMQQARATVSLEAGAPVHVYLYVNTAPAQLWGFADGRASLTIRRIGARP